MRIPTIAAVWSVSVLAACGEPQLCRLENHCIRDGDDGVRCQDGYTWEDPDDEENFNCVPLPFDLTVSDVTLAPDIIGNPEVFATIVNGFETTLDEARFRATMFDNDDEVREYGSGSSSQGLVSETDLAPGASRNPVWTMFGYDGANGVRFEVTGVQLVDEDDLRNCEGADCCFSACFATESTCPDYCSDEFE